MMLPDQLFSVLIISASVGCSSPRLGSILVPPHPLCGLGRVGRRRGAVLVLLVTGLVPVATQHLSVSTLL